jgi:hypothetical protein
MGYLGQSFWIEIRSLPPIYGGDCLKDFSQILNFITSYHPQTDGKIERVNQIIEDMLRMYVMDKPSKWEYYLHLVEFAYNNGYQDSLIMSPFEALYDRKYNTLVR